MEDHGAAFPSWYITFQQAALAALPRPPKMDQDTALGWADNGEAMQRAFLQVLVPPSELTQAVPKQKNAISINRAVPFNPTEFIGKGWSIWRGPADGDGLSGEEDQDERSLALTELDPASIILETYLQDDKNLITGEERIALLKAADRIRLDAAIFNAFLRNQALIPKEWEKKINGYTAYIFFDGTPLRSPDGRRYALFLYLYVGEWHWDGYWLGGGRDASYPSAVLASI